MPVVLHSTQAPAGSQSEESFIIHINVSHAPVFPTHIKAMLHGAGRPHQALLSGRLLLSLAYGANVTTSYMLMLAVMTFNVGYFITIVAGLTVGHFLLFSTPAEGGTGVSMLSELCCPQPGS